MKNVITVYLYLDGKGDEQSCEDAARTAELMYEYGLIKEQYTLKTDP